MKIRKAFDKVIWMQRQIKSYQSKKKQWAAEIYLELDKERVKLRDFIKLIKNENERE